MINCSCRNGAERLVWVVCLEFCLPLFLAAEREVALNTNEEEWQSGQADVKWSEAQHVTCWTAQAMRVAFRAHQAYLKLSAHALILGSFQWRSLLAAQDEAWRRWFAR